MYHLSELELADVSGLLVLVHASTTAFTDSMLKHVPSRAFLLRRGFLKQYYNNKERDICRVKLKCVRFITTYS
jgi:hypothetical protein